MNITGRRMRSGIYSALLICVLSFATSAFAGEEHPVDFLTAKNSLTVLGGYGISHKGLGATATRVETVDVIFRYGHFLTEELGESWYRGRHEILVEIPLRTVIHPESAIMTGITFLASWNFTAGDKIVPHIFAGGGPVYTNLDIPGLGTELNYSYQGGAGFNYFIRKNMGINFNYRLYHMSNAGTAEPNEPLNFSRILIGVTIYK